MPGCAEGDGLVEGVDEADGDGFGVVTGRAGALVAGCVERAREGFGVTVTCTVAVAVAVGVFTGVTGCVAVGWSGEASSSIPTVKAPIATPAASSQNQTGKPRASARIR